MSKNQKLNKTFKKFKAINMVFVCDLCNQQHCLLNLSFFHHLKKKMDDKDEYDVYVCWRCDVKDEQKI
jgi:hypothetical protein